MSSDVELRGGGHLPLRDEPDPSKTLLSRQAAYHGHVWDVAVDRVDLGGGAVVTRDVIAHPGAVGVLVLDEDERMLVIRQYRHPVGQELWELPAGLLDSPGEPALAAAQRELAEEVDLSAATWHVLADIFTSPGGSTEALRIYVARNPADVPESARYQRTDEERDLISGWVTIDAAVAAVLAGEVQNPTLVVAALAAFAARAANWAPLRPADAPWQGRSPGTMT